MSDFSSAFEAQVFCGLLWLKLKLCSRVPGTQTVCHSQVQQLDAFIVALETHVQKCNRRPLAYRSLATSLSHSLLRCLHLCRFHWQSVKCKASSANVDAASASQHQLKSTQLGSVRLLASDSKSVLAEPFSATQVLRLYAPSVRSSFFVWTPVERRQIPFIGDRDYKRSRSCPKSFVWQEVDYKKETRETTEIVCKHICSQAN